MKFQAHLYHAPYWLRGKHVQTIYPALWLPRPTITYQRERWLTYDDDFIDVDVAFNPASPNANKLLILFHGLEGSSSSFYAQYYADYFTKQGWTVAIPHFRGCSGESNWQKRAYFAGDLDEILWILQKFSLKYGKLKRYAVGVSLGANALLKCLGHYAHLVSDLLTKTVAISTPFDLIQSGKVLDKGWNRLFYTRHFLKTLIPNIEKKCIQYPEIIDLKKLNTIKTLYDFDNLITSQLHGFKDALDYWQKCSSINDLISIQIPTLLINAKNDPFFPAHCLPKKSQLSDHIVTCYPEQGGHVGFVTGRFPGRFDWVLSQTERFFNAF